MGQFRGKAKAALLTVGLLFSAVAPVRAANILQCVPYARVVSGLSLYGDAWTWWDQAEGHYDRGHKPKKGAVLAFERYGPMQLGHVAVVSKVLSRREILIRHANWSTPGAIEEDVLAIDVSEEGDWSAVRVWHTPTGQMGARTNPTFGFIYPRHAKLMPYNGGLGEPLVQTAEYNAPRAVQPFDEDKPKRSRKRIKLAYADMTGGDDVRTLGDIIADVRREAGTRGGR